MWIIFACVHPAGSAQTGIIATCSLADEIRRTVSWKAMSPLTVARATDLAGLLTRWFGPGGAASSAFARTLQPSG